MCVPQVHPYFFPILQTPKWTWPLSVSEVTPRAGAMGCRRPSTRRRGVHRVGLEELPKVEGYLRRDNVFRPASLAIVFRAAPSEHHPVTPQEHPCVATAGRPHRISLACHADTCSILLLHADTCAGFDRYGPAWRPGLQSTVVGPLHTVNAITPWASPERPFI